MRRTWKPVAAGVSNITAGVPAVGGGIATVIVGGGITGLHLSTLLERLADMDVASALSGLTVLSPLLSGALGAILIPIGVLSVAGGAGAVRRRCWRPALPGCVGAAAFIPCRGLRQLSR
jgi:hypothetical protein